ncbi:hypothetical protein P9139_08190 [Curtobacterium flaccumfaciens]|nr:hypothetical protein P9139_08190 [Curtobacterium flaccumfaciens]
MNVISAGMAVVTDLGRHAGPSIGLSVNGALDQHAARTANVLVGNDDRAALVEVTASEVVVEFDHDQVVAVTGAQALVLVDDDVAP